MIHIHFPYCFKYSIYFIVFKQCISFQARHCKCSMWAHVANGYCIGQYGSKVFWLFNFLIGHTLFEVLEVRCRI